MAVAVIAVVGFGVGAVTGLGRAGTGGARTVVIAVRGRRIGLAEADQKAGGEERREARHSNDLHTFCFLSFTLGFASLVSLSVGQGPTAPVPAPSSRLNPGQSTHLLSRFTRAGPRPRRRRNDLSLSSAPALKSINAARSAQLPVGKASSRNRIVTVLSITVTYSAA